MGPVTQRILKFILGLAVILFVAANVIYWQDPWLWRGYVQMLRPGDPRAEEFVRPYEEIRGDGSYVLPMAVTADRTIADDALKAMEVYAQDFGSHALIVIHKGVIQDEWYNDGRTARQISQSQSMHKTLMGLFVGIAIAEGKIDSTDDPIGKYIPEWKDDPRGRITLFQMLTMSSGLTQPKFDINPFSRGIGWMNSGRSRQIILETSRADWAPGTKYDYNNLNSEILGMAIEKVYGRRYSDLLAEKLWRPMGGERALVHTDTPGGRAYTSCCLGAPAMDWARIGMMFLGKGEVNGHRIVPADWIEKMTARSPAAQHYGLQIWLGYDDPPFPANAGSSGAIATEPFLARDTFMLWGRGQQHVFVVPSHDLVIVRLGPALGRMPIKPGFDVPRLVNTAIRGMKAS